MSLAFIFLALIAFKQSSASHFRGGAITWAPVNPNIAFPVSQVEVYITTRFFWKLVSTQCDSSACIAAGNLIGDNASISPYNGNSWSITSQTRCYDYSTADQWMAGVFTQKVNVTTSMAVGASFASCCWVTGIKSVSGSTNWNLTFVIDLKQRADTHRINSSPTTTINPYIKLSTGCSNNQSLAIPVNDVDMDLVRCRCSTSVCLTGFSMDSVNCILYFNPILSGFYTLEILIEDFAASNPKVALSSVPLQFIANVGSNTLNCCNYFFAFVLLCQIKYFFGTFLNKRVEFYSLRVKIYFLKSKIIYSIIQAALRARFTYDEIHFKLFEKS